MFDRRVAISECTLVVLQLNLRHRPVEIGFGEVGFESNDLVEILNGEHIVLKIQRILADRGDAVGVELRVYRSTEYRVQNTD